MDYALTPEAFLSWLCEQDTLPIGYPRSFYHSPLALWLTDLYQHVCGVDGRFYGRPSQSPETWRVLPIWAQRFAARLENYPYRPLYASELLDLLAHVERTLSAA